MRMTKYLASVASDEFIVVRALRHHINSIDEELADHVNDEFA